MRGGGRVALVVAVLGALAPGGVTRGQVSELPLQPAPVLPAPRQADAPGASLASPAPVVPVAPPAAPPPPHDTLFDTPDPGRDGWGPYGPPSPPPGYFFDLDLQIIRPVLLNRISNDIPLANGAMLHVPSADLNWTVAPWFEVGYRLPESWGFVAAGYRFFDSDGSTDEPPGDGGLVSHVHTRAALNMVDLDYGTTPYSFAPRWDWIWRAGVRYGNVFWDSRLQNPLTDQQSSNFFTGFGPHARLDLLRHVPEVPGLALWTRFDGSVLIGRVNQRYRDLETAEDGTQQFFANDQNSTQAVPTMLLQAGLEYTPPGRENLHLNLGYVYERWWYVGQVGLSATAGGIISNSHGEIGSQGISLRAQWDF
jgi:hypothetical protein